MSEQSMLDMRLFQRFHEESVRAEKDLGGREEMGDPLIRHESLDIDIL
jgi:hypothetical protein